MNSVSASKGDAILVVFHDAPESRAALQVRRVGEQTFTDRSCDAWRHPVGVAHSSVALEDCLPIEVKSPPRKTWSTRG